MKIVIYSRPDGGQTSEGLQHLIGALVESGLPFIINQEFADNITSLTGNVLEPEMTYDDRVLRKEEDMVALSYGGDGTFLDCVRLFSREGIPVLGINSGRLGFLANIPQDGVRQALEDLKCGNYDTEQRKMISAAGDFGQDPQYPYAFNEFSIQRSGTGMISVETYVDGEMIATYWGDGVILSTPAGSTAYSLSVGGPVVAPGCNCLVLAPIAPHNLTMRPVVVPDTSVVKFRVRSRGEGCYVTLDNTNFLVEDGAGFTVKICNDPVFLIRLQNISFYQTLRNKMLWGLDRRDPVRK